MSGVSEEEKSTLHAVDATGQEVDLSEFEESFYKAGQVDESLKCTKVRCRVLKKDRSYAEEYCGLPIKKSSLMSISNLRE